MVVLIQYYRDRNGSEEHYYTDVAETREAADTLLRSEGFRLDHSDERRKYIHSQDKAQVAYLSHRTVFSRFARTS